jgi:hypothetical protein
MEVEGDVGADKRVPRVSEKKRERAYRFGRDGPCAVFGRGPNSVTGPFPLLSILFSFFFSDFCLKILQITSDLIQTNFVICKKFPFVIIDIQGRFDQRNSNSDRAKVSDLSMRS